MPLYQHILNKIIHLKGDEIINVEDHNIQTRIIKCKTGDVEDRRTKDERSFTISPEWSLKTTTFFDLRQEEYQFSPFNLINRFSSLMWQGKKEEIDKYLLPGAAGQQVWSVLNHRYWHLVRREHVNFVGSHAGFDNVFSLNITFGQQKPDHSGSAGGPIPVASQNIYLIDNGGKPFIVGADPLKILKPDNPGA